MSRRRSSKPGGLLLFHGAGGDRDHRLFLALEEALDLPVARSNFPYRDKGPGRRPPDRMPKLIETIVQRVEQYSQEWGVDPESLVIGGRSLGGRAASMAIAEGLAVTGLLLLSYPLHPQGKPDKLRIDHLGDLKVPVLLVQGESDPMGRRHEMEEHAHIFGGPLTQVWLERTGHDPAAKHDQTVIDGVTDWLGSLA